MTDANLIGRLRRLEPPPGDAALERAKLAVRSRVARRAAAKSRPGRFAAARPRLAVALAVVLAALAATAVFTPPGQAFTSWVGERLGFGDPGGPPTLRDLRAFATEGRSEGEERAYVLLRRPVPGFGHYELVTYRTKDEPGKQWPANGARCYELDFPEERSIGGPRCGLPDSQHPLRFDGIGGSFKFDHEPLIHVSGRVSSEVDSVEVDFNGEPVPVDLAPIPAELIDRFQIRRPFKFFIALLRNGERGGPVTITARDAAGQVLARRKTRAINHVEMQRGICKMAKRQVREGKLKRRFLRFSCRLFG